MQIVINNSVANLRKGPNHREELLSQYLLGEKLNITGQEKNSFFPVVDSMGYQGWIEQEEFSSDERASSPKEKTIIITSDYSKAYSSPDLDSSCVSDLVLGNQLHLLAEDKYFFRVQFPDKRIAYVGKNSASMLGGWKNQQQKAPDILLQIAKRFLGVPYLWGGTSVKGFDCSGFVQFTYRMCGIILERDASQQANAGSEIIDHRSIQNLRKGDLLFFGSEKEGKLQIGHVAIYCEEGRYIHASGRVRINSFLPNDELFAPKRLETFVKAKRIL